MKVPPEFETVAARRIQIADLVNSESPRGDRLFALRGMPSCEFGPAARLTETAGVKMLPRVAEMNVPNESLARYTWNASVPGPPLSLWKSAMPVTFTVSMNEDPRHDVVHRVLGRPPQPAVHVHVEDRAPLAAAGREARREQRHPDPSPVHRPSPSRSRVTSPSRWRVCPTTRLSGSRTRRRIPRARTGC